MDKQLGRTISTLKKEGYTADQVRTYLLRMGYTSKDIDAALRAKSINRLIAIALVIGTLALILFISLFGYRTFLAAPLSIQTSVLPTEVRAGDTIIIMTNISGKPNVIRIRHQLAQADRVYREKTETVAMEPGKPYIYTLTIPETVTAGIYTIATTVQSDDHIATASTSIRILALEIPEEIPEVEEEVLVENVTEIVPPEIEEVPQVEIRGTTQLEKLYAVIEMEDLDEALKLCRSLGIAASIDTCYLEIAKKTNKLQTCALISSDTTKEQCYLEMAYRGNQIACFAIQTPEVREACRQLQAVLLKEDFLP